MPRDTEVPERVRADDPIKTVFPFTKVAPLAVETVYPPMVWSPCVMRLALFSSVPTAAPDVRVAASDGFPLSAVSFF